MSNWRKPKGHKARGYWKWQEDEPAPDDRQEPDHYHEWKNRDKEPRAHGQAYEKTHRGGKSQKRKVRREARIREQMLADQAQSDDERETAAQNKSRWTPQETRKQLEEWSVHGWDVPNAIEMTPANRAEEPDEEDVRLTKMEYDVLDLKSVTHHSDEENDADAEDEHSAEEDEHQELIEMDDSELRNPYVTGTRLDEEISSTVPGVSSTVPLTPTPPDSEDERIQAKQASNAQELASEESDEQGPPSSATEMPVPTEKPSPTSPEDPEDDFGVMIEAKDNETLDAAPAERHVSAPAVTKLQPLLPPKEFEPLKRQKQEVVPKPVYYGPTKWPAPKAAPAEQHKCAPAKVISSSPSYSKAHPNPFPPVMGIGISDLHKVLDTDRGHIRRSYSRNFEEAFENGIVVNVLSYIGKNSHDKRSDAHDKMNQFNSFLEKVLPKFKGTPYLPVPLYICNYRTNNNGKLSTIQQWYELEEEDPRVLGVIDDAPDVCEEVECGNLRAYRVYGGSRTHQLHEQHQPVFRDFPSAMKQMIADFNSGCVPLCQEKHRKSFQGKARTRLGADPTSAIDLARYAGKSGGY